MLTLLYIIDTIYEFEMEAEKISLVVEVFRSQCYLIKITAEKCKEKMREYLQIYKYLIKPKKPFKKWVSKDFWANTFTVNVYHT